MVLIRANITQLVGDTTSRAYRPIDVAMRMTKYPAVNVAVGDEISQFHRESSVDTAVPELRSCQQQGWDVMSHHHLVLSLGLCHRFFNKSEASVMFLVEHVRSEIFPVAKNLAEVRHALRDGKEIHRIDVPP